ncbi:ribonucleotide-diphosphate reductase subunit beta [Paenibacillus xylanexedens]|uniref:ribonucleotide-diphosphate reductase subunit beta n=1 Tax=Paenibacillus xylanexedens TaxID=528191 RepID=UPI000FA1D16B|nr:ribonucleotide-diphosphate reductase subunit beta [Paenibacillus xylanexedens]RPK31743.1 Ribonucleotide reductase [Paenibacillus xylanexedens]
MSFRVFNGEVKNKATKIFGGVASGICDWDDIKYPHMLTLYKELFGNYWIEDEIRLTNDLKQYRDSLTEREKYVYNVLTGMLTSLDSVANRFNFTIGHTCTDPSVAAVIQIIGAFEGLHARSYQYLTSTMLNSEEKKQAFNAPKEIHILRERNNMIFDKIQDFIDNPTDFNKLYHALLANLVLEGVFFTGAFVYFNSLARSNRMIGSNNMVNLIKTDENFHSVFYGDVMKILMLENEQLNTKENYNNAINFIRFCVEKEKEWADYIFDGIDILSVSEYKDYIEYLSNVICRNAGLEEVYPDNKELKSQWIITYGTKGGNTKGDFFQTNVISYGHESGDGFDL